MQVLRLNLLSTLNILVDLAKVWAVDLAKDWAVAVAKEWEVDLDKP